MVSVAKEFGESDMISAAEVAHMLGVKYKTILMWTQRGKFPVHSWKIGGRRKYSKAEVEKYLETIKTGDFSVDNVGK